MSHLRLSSLLATGLIAAAALSPAGAQTTLKLNYNQNGIQTCTYTTDAAGVALDPATGNLVASGTFGAGCPTTPINPPSFTNTIDTDIASTITVNTTQTLTWAADADSCVYDGSSFPAGVTFANWPTSGSACTGSSCNTTHTVNLVPAAVGSYTFKLTCTRSGSPTQVVSTVTTTASAVDTSCAGPSGLTRQTTGRVVHISGNVNRNNVDLTKFENVFGYQGTANMKLWPGVLNLQAMPTINSNQFVALKFTVPANFAINTGGYMGVAETNTQSPVTISYSTVCGDFSVPNPISVKCQIDNGGTGSQMLWGYYATGSGAYNGSCHLTPGQTYYMNIMTAPLGNPTQSSCGAASCNVNFQNGPGSF